MTADLVISLFYLLEEITLNTKYYAQNVSQIERELKTSLDKGLSNEEAKQRLAKDGPNSLASKKNRSMFMRFIDQFKDFYDYCFNCSCYFIWL